LIQWFNKSLSLGQDLLTLRHTFLLTTVNVKKRTSFFAQYIHTHRVILKTSSSSFSKEKSLQIETQNFLFIKNWIFLYSLDQFCALKGRAVTPMLCSKEPCRNSNAFPADLLTLRPAFVQHLIHMGFVFDKEALV